MTRLTENDHQFGPITYGRASWRATRFVLSSGGDGDDKPQNSLTIYLLGWIFRINIPNIIRPYRIRHTATSWDSATIQRLGRDWYDEIFPREYGFSLNDGFLQLFLGAQTHDSIITQDWCCHLPWTQWRHVRYSLYTPEGQHFWTEQDGSNIREYMAKQEACPFVSFLFEDYDGEQIIATCRIQEREWHYGTGWFKWLSLFRGPKINRSLDLKFSSEVGPEKGSWKGGTIGHGIDMLPNESCEAAFRRYCEQEHRSKYMNFNIKFIGVNQK